MLLAASSGFARSEYDKGSSAYKRGDYETAVAVFRPLAEDGDAKAQSILAMMYNYGEGVPVDHRESARWYRRAAEQNYSVAQYNLGLALLEGKGMKANTDEAIEWLTKAADNGHFRARSQLANLDTGYYSDLESPPADSLEAPPTVSAPKSESRSVVMRKQAPAAAAPKRAPQNTGSAVAVTTTSVAANSTPPTPKRPTTTHTEANNNSTQHPVGAPQPSTKGNRVYRVQLVASRSEERIRSHWSSYRQRFSDIFAGLDGSVERAEIGEEKTVWYRLRIGPFASEASAKELCSKLAARNVETGCLLLRASR
jgi:cell division septation protein DedD